MKEPWRPRDVETEPNPERRVIRAPGFGSEPHSRPYGSCERVSNRPARGLEQEPGPVGRALLELRRQPPIILPRKQSPYTGPTPPPETLRGFVQVRSFRNRPACHAD